jgi:hypothetical protein
MSALTKYKGNVTFTNILTKKGFNIPDILLLLLLLMSILVTMATRFHDLPGVTLKNA